MKNIFYIFAITCLLASFTHSQPQYNISFETFAPNIQTDTIAAYGDGYVMGNYYLETQTGFSNQIVPSSSCTRAVGKHQLDLAITINIEFFCLQVNGSQSFLNQIVPTNSSIIASYPYNGNNTASVTTSDNFVILLGDPIEGNSFSADVFDATAQEWVCHVPEINFGINNNFTTVTMISGALVFTTVSSVKPFNSSYYYIPCSTGLPIVTSTHQNLNPYDVWAFNQSTVLLIRSEIGDYSYLTGASFDLTGTAFFGTSLNVGPYYSSSKINDTYYLIPTYNPNQEFQFDMDFIVITQKLDIKVVLNYQSGLAITAYYFGTVMLGTNYWVVNDGVTYFYDYTNRSIAGVWSAGDSIVMANNSVINMTNGGYFIQSPGEPIYFISAPIINGGGLLVADYNDVWSFYTPEFIPVFGFDYCILTQFQKNTSKITHYGFAKCPINQLNFVGILTLQGVYFQEGNPNPWVAYTCTFANLVVVNQNEVVAERVLNITVPASVTVNLTSMTATVLKNDYYNTTAFIIDLKNGSIVKSLPISYAAYTGTSRLNNNYYMIGANITKTTGFFAIIDVNNLQIVSNFTFNFTYERLSYFFSPFFLMGTDPFSSNYSAIVLQTLDNSLVLVDPQGTYTEINVGNKSQLVQYIVNSNIFLACYFDDIFIYTDTINISN